MRKPLRSPIDRRYRHAGTLSTSVLLAVAGVAMCAGEVGVWWADVAATAYGVALVVFGVWSAGRELAKPCRFAEQPGPQVVPPIPRVLRDEGRAS